MNQKKAKETVKLMDVAIQSGVSTSTASMVFSNTGRISTKTRDKVLSTANLLNYKHQSRKKNVKTMLHVGVLLSIDKEWRYIWNFLADMIAQIEQELHSLNMKMLLIPISHNESNEMIYEKISSFGCRAVFSIHIGRKDLFKTLEKENIPLIVILNNDYQDMFFSICVDDFQGAYEGTRHLLSLGHRRINFVDVSRDDLPILSSDRYYGYLKAIEESGIELSNTHRISCGEVEETASLERQLSNIMKDSDPPTALFCLDDEIALMALNILKNLGYAIPNDVSIIAPGDVLDYEKSYIPPITTMRIDMIQVGKLAVEILNNRLNSTTNTIHVLKVKQQMKDRGSSCPINQ